MQTLTIPAKCANDMEAARKTAALTKIATNLSLENLLLIANASGKPNANAKLQQYKAFL